MNIARLLVVFVILGALAAAGWWFFARDRGQPATSNPPPATSTLPPDDGRFRWGVQVRPYALNRYSDELMMQQLDLAADLGVGWIRLDWHNFNDFAWHDNIIEEANARGLHVVLILEEIGVAAADPDVVAKASKAAGDLAKHFKGKVRYYQLLNEVSGAAL